MMTHGDRQRLLDWVAEDPDGFLWEFSELLRNAMNAADYCDFGLIEDQFWDSLGIFLRDQNEGYAAPPQMAKRTDERSRYVSSYDVPTQLELNFRPVRAKIQIQGSEVIKTNTVYEVDPETGNLIESNNQLDEGAKE